MGDADRDSSGRKVVDGLVLDGREVWLLVDDDEGVGPLIDTRRGPLRLCREVRAGGVLVLGEARPGRDPLLSELSRTRRADPAGPFEEMDRIRHGC